MTPWEQRVSQSNCTRPATATCHKFLLAEQWESQLRTSPIFASFLGDKRWNDKFDDLSQEAVDKNLQETQKFLARFEAIDTSGFPDQEALNKTLMVRDLKWNWMAPASNPGKRPSTRGAVFTSSPQYSPRHWWGRCKNA